MGRDTGSPTEAEDHVRGTARKNGESLTLPDAPREVRFGVTTYLTIWLLLLYAISARQVLGPLGAIGQPSLLVALGAAFLWIAGWTIPGSGLSRDRHPLRPAVLIYLWYSGASFAIAMSRPLTELEASGATRALVTAVAMAGIALLVADGIPTSEQLSKLLRNLVLVGTLLSIIGILQFFTGATFQLRLPGLTWLTDAPGGVGGRSIFNRPRSNTQHPIEFSVVTAALLPLAIHYALYGSTLTRRRNYATCAALIAFAMPLAISRSGLVSLVAGLAVMFLGWGWRRRLYGLLITAIAVPVLWLTIPGIVGTFRSMFTGTDTDPSIQARIDRIPRIMETIREYPWFGRGNGTWSVDDYFLIDNELWVTTIEMGIVGIVATFALIALGIGTAVSVRYLPAADEQSGHLGLAVGASTAALAISILTFDAFHYRILTSTLFLLLGSAGALWRSNAQGPRRPHDTNLPVFSVESSAPR